MAVESVITRTPNFIKTAQAEGPFTTVATASATLKAVPVAEDQAVMIIATVIAYTDDFSNVARFQLAAAARRVAAGDVTVSSHKVDEVGSYNGNRPRVRVNANTGTQEAEIVADGRSGEDIIYFIESLVIESV